jgi:hypothetical protein
VPRNKIHVGDNREKICRFSSGNLKGRHVLENLGVDGRILLMKQGVGVWNIFIWLRITSNGGL